MFQSRGELRRLAGGSRDLNNMLTPVMGFAELAANSLRNPRYPLLDEVAANAARLRTSLQMPFAGRVDS